VWSVVGLPCRGGKFPTCLYSSRRADWKSAPTKGPIGNRPHESTYVAELGRAEQRLAEAAPGGQRRVGPVGLLLRLIARGALVVGQVILDALDLLLRRGAAQRRPIGRVDAPVVAHVLSPQQPGGKCPRVASHEGIVQHEQRLRRHGR